MDENSIWLINQEPTHATIVNNKTLDPSESIELTGGEQIHLGGNREGGAHLTFIKKLGDHHNTTALTATK